MNTLEIKNTIGMLSRVNISKVADKDLRKNLFNAYLTLSKANKEFEEDIKTLQEKAFEKIDLNAHNELVEQIQEAERAGDNERKAELIKQLNPETVKAIRDFNEFYEEKMRESKEVALEKVDANLFVDMMIEQDFALSMAELDMLTNTILK